uniref:Uncharacterized protein n=1 Tax=Chromera velia CCMP2878 TaxID=1169474 RepID=A0A0G4FCL2_9ALVE|eukprot:Cvel_16147.t1-p1 / transcript=Cvel_16147.t1 / gene=Cvel_16147 / organism=Chromera_velia_CCMP2878 / gene_product=hypothetical protein / transcript_product=hypothetical protein / location=Cvel_scaffold1230:114-3150(+) / protein_length=581 / sequence_SO=supercontig / SO=protein_coding / is_pseudo=false
MLFATRRPSNPETVDVIGPLRHAPPLLCFFSCLLVILVAPLLGASGDSGNAWTVLGKKAESEGVHGTVGSSLDSVGTSDEELGAEGDDGDEGRAYAQRIRGITGKERRKRMDMNGRRVEGRRGDREWGGYGEEPYTRGGRLTPLREEDEDYYGDEISLRSPTERRERDRNDHSSARTVIFKGDGGSDGEEDGEGRSSRRGRKGGEKGRTFLDRLWTDFDETYLRPLFGGPDVVASNLREARILKAQQRRLRTAKQQEGGQESSYRSHGGDHSDAPYESRVNYFPSTPAGSYGRINSRRYFTHHAERSGGAGRSAPDVHRYRESPATRDAVQKAPAYFLRKERGRVDVGVGGGARDYDAIGREEETEESGYSRAYYQRAQGAPPSRPHARRGEPSDASYDQRGPPAVRFAQMRGRGGESGYDHGGGGGYGSSRSDYDRGVSGGQLDRSAGSSVRGREGQGSRYGAGNPFPPTPAQYIERGWQGPRAEDSYMWSGEEPGARGGSWRGGVSGRSDASGGYRDYPRGGGGSDLGPRGDRGPERYDRRQPHEYQSGGRNADSAARRAAQYDAREYDQEGVQARYIR